MFVLDLVIVSKEIEQYVEELNIDKELQWTPSRNYKGQLKFPDHFALLLTLNIPMANTKHIPTKKNIIWNTKKQNGWERYKAITENNKELDRATNMESDDPEVIWKIIDTQMTKAKFASFGKVKIKSKGKDEKELEALQQYKIQISTDAEHNEKESKVEKIDTEMANVIEKIQSKQFERDLNKLENVKKDKGKAAAVFTLKEKILGKKKIGQEPTILKDPDTGKELSKPDEIKKASLNYCIKLLTNRRPKEEYRDIIEDLEKVHKERMNEKVEDDIEELPVETFVRIFNYLKSKPGNKYDFIIKSGNSLLASIFKLFQIIWKGERIPDAWRESLLTQLFKGRGDFRECDSQRFIHEKNCILKFFQQIVMFYTKPIVYQNMTKFQIACKPGHRPAEHLFVVKSVMTLYKAHNKGLIYSSFDLRKFYDSEKLTDCMAALYSRQVK